MSHKASRYHDISCGHRVVGHENKCRHLHGHNYRVHFVCALGKGVWQSENEGLDHIGRVIDFTAIKEKLCMWVENNWDHKFLAWENDQLMRAASRCLREDEDEDEHYVGFEGSIVWLPFNPTAENMAEYLVNVIAPIQLKGTGVELVEVVIEETAKCHASFSL